MTEDSNPPPQGGDDRTPPSRGITLKPTYKQDNPNPHAHSRGLGRAYLPTPATIAGHVWRRIGLESHLVLSLFLLPLAALVVYLHTIGVQTRWLGVFSLTVALSYGIYYAWAPRESKHVIARLENVYHARRFAVVSSGIAAMSILSTVLLIMAILSEVYFPVTVVDTSITIATTGMALGLFSSYILVHVLVARALPVQSNEPLLDRLVGIGTAVEVAFILAAIGAPAFMFAAQFLWNRPPLFTVDVTLSRNAAALLLAGFTVLYTSLITRM